MSFLHQKNRKSGDLKILFENLEIQYKNLN